MIELETRSSSDNDKHNKHHKYTLDEALQAVLEFNDVSDYSIHLIRGLSLKYQSYDFNQPQLVFVTNRNGLMIQI